MVFSVQLLFSILLRFLMVIMMAGIIFTEPDVDVDADANVELKNKAALWTLFVDLQGRF